MRKITNWGAKIRLKIPQVDRQRRIKAAWPMHMKVGGSIQQVGLANGATAEVFVAAKGRRGEGHGENHQLRMSL